MQITYLKREFQALSELTDGIGTDRFWDQFRSLIVKVVPFDDLVVLTYSDAATPICPFHTLDAERYELLIKDYLTGPYLLDPFYERATQSEQTGVAGLRQIAPDKFRATEYYERHYSRTGIRDEIGIFLPRVEGRRDVISLLRVGESRRYTPTDIDSLDARAPMLLNLCARHLAHAPRAGEDRKPLGHQAFEGALHQAQTDLSPREVEIAKMILRGHSSLSIALNLDIAEGTVKNHRKSIYRKLGISSQAELFSFFLEQLLSEPN